MTHQKHEVTSASDTSMSYYTMVTLFSSLLINKPQQFATITALWTTKSLRLSSYLGNEALYMLESLYPELYDIIYVILTSKEQTNIDALYGTIHPRIERLLNKKIADYGVSLNDVHFQTYLSESFVKKTLLPLFLLVRDIPKFCQSIKEKQFFESVQNIKAQLSTRLETTLHSEIRKYLKIGANELYPLVTTEPALVTQIKKILNALSYAEQVISFINALELNPDTSFKLEALLEQKGKSKVSFITQIIWYLVFKDSRSGAYLSFPMDLMRQELDFLDEIERIIGFLRIIQSSLLEIDMPLYQLFHREINYLNMILKHLEQWTNDDTDNLISLRMNEMRSTVAYGLDIGQPLGTFVAQLNPQKEKTDYSDLTSQLSLLPGYLNQLSQLIYSYSDQPQKHMALTENQAEIYKDASIKLFYELSQLNDLSSWQQYLSILMPIRYNLATLSCGAYEQITQNQAAINAMAEHQLYLLKNIFLANLICGVDRFELYMGCAFGALTKPLMLQLNDLYQKTVGHINNLVNLKESNPDLLQLDNTSFLTLRLQNILQQKNECQKKVDSTLKAKKDLQSFCALFDRFLNPAEKINLNEYYLSFKSYVIDYNPRLSVLIDQTLAPEGQLQFTMQELALMQQSINELCDKDIATFNCYLTLADSRLIDLTKQIKSNLYALNPHKVHSILIINEPLYLKIDSPSTQVDTAPSEHQFIDDLVNLTTKQRAALHDYYTLRILSLAYIEDQITLFLQQIDESNWLSNTKKVNAIIDRYRVIQPYLVDSIKQKQNETDALFVSLLYSSPTKKIKQPHVILSTMNSNLSSLQKQISNELIRSRHRQALFEFAHQIEKIRLLNDEPLTPEMELVLKRMGLQYGQALFEFTHQNGKIILLNNESFTPERKLVLQRRELVLKRMASRHRNDLAKFEHQKEKTLLLKNKPLSSEDKFIKLMNKGIPYQHSLMASTLELLLSRNRQALLEFEDQKEKSLLLYNKPLTLESDLVKRQDKWIRHQHLSRVSALMSKTLVKLLNQFDSSLKLPKTIERADNTVPFPEMEQDLEALAVPSQVSWAKRLINVIHYINSTFKYLESLDKNLNPNSKQYYLKSSLIDGINQLKPFLELTNAYQTFMELIKEPFGQLFKDSLQESSNELMDLWGALHPLYFANAHSIKIANPQPINNNGLWYAFLSTLVIPEHLNQLAQGKSYTANHAQQAQEKAKELTQSIESITEAYQMGRYFRLILKSPTVLFHLLPELKSKIERLRTATYENIRHHLKDIRFTLYHLLQLTDNLEFKFGLQIGLVSIPTKKILDQLFSGFIEPLGISLLESAQLIADTSSFQERLQNNRQKNKEAAAMLLAEKQQLAVWAGFLKQLQTIKKLLDTQQEIDPTLQEQFTQQYKTLYLSLQYQHRHYPLALNQRDKSKALDDFCEQCFQQVVDTNDNHIIYHYTSLSDVLYLTKHIHAAKKGSINTLEMRLMYLNAQAQFINNERHVFEKEKRKEALESTISHTIDQQIEKLCKNIYKPIYLSAECIARLSKKLSSKKEELIKKAHDIPVENLEQVIADELNKQLELFKKTEYMKLLHLNCILEQIERFQAYCVQEQKHPFFENTAPQTGTLDNKVNLLASLQKMAQDESIEDLDQRIEAIQREAKKASFKSILISCDHRVEFNSKTLRRMFYNLFHSIFNFFGMNYAPQDIYKSLNNAISKPSTSIGFFNSAGMKEKTISKDSIEPDPLNNPDLFRR